MRVKPLDDIDRRIIAHLREDGRRSFTVIGRDVGLSEASVRQRVARMTRQGVIRIWATTTPTALGFLSASLCIKVTKGDHQAIAEQIAGLPGIDFVSLCIGAYDINVDVLAEGREELYDVLVRKIRAIEGVGQTDVMIHNTVIRDTLDRTLLRD